MPTSNLESIKETLSAARDSLSINIDDPEFIESISKAAALLLTTVNRIIVTGMGKSALIAHKIAATMTSTGSASVFLHAADALHGDVGNVQSKEVVIALSNSGETRELVELLPHLRLLGAKIIAITQNPNSTLAKEADIAIVFKLTKEGCPLDLAPMASTTISLAIGDALASALIKLKGFEKKDFGRYHPSGALGRRLLTRVRDVLVPNQKSSVLMNSDFAEIVSTMVSSNLGAVAILDTHNKLCGIVTDGDIKRMLESNISNEWNALRNKKASDLASNNNPFCVSEDALIEEALNIMHERKVYILPVVDIQEKYIGIIRMHDLISTR